MGITLDENGNWIDDTNLQNDGNTVAQGNAEQADSANQLYNSIGGLVGSAATSVGKSINDMVPDMSAPVLAPPTSMKSGMSVSQSGLNPSAVEWAESPTGGKKGYAKDLAVAHNAGASLYHQLTDGQDALATEKKAAITAQTDAEVAKNDFDAKLQQDYAHQQRLNAIDDQKDYAAINTKVASYMADYQQSVKELASAIPNPGLGYSLMTPGGRAGTVMTAFIQDFLRAKGVNTSGLDMIHQGIDMTIQAQRDAYEAKKDIAGQKLNIYKIFREQGDNDYLAATKTRATMLEAFRNEGLGRLAQMNSPIAQAKAQALSAVVDDEQLKISADAAKSAANLETQRAEIAQRARGDSLQAGAASERAKIDRADLEFRKKQYDDAHKAKPPAKPPANPLMVHTTSGEVLGIAPDDVTQRKFQEQVIGHEELIDKTNKLTKALKAAGPTYTGPGGSMLLNTDEAKYSALYNDVLRGYIRSQTGAVANQQEIESMKKVIPWASLSRSLLTSDSSEDTTGAIYAQFGGQNLDELKNESRAILRAPTPEEIETFRGGYNPAALDKSEGLQTETNALTAPSAPLSKVQKAAGLTESTGGKETDPVRFKGDSDSVIQDLEGAGLFKYGTTTDMGNAGKAGFVNVVNSDNVDIPRWTTGVHKVYDIAVDPQADAKDRKEAVDTLVSMVKDPGFSFPGFKSDEKANQAVSTFAMYLLSQIPQTAGGQIPSKNSDGTEYSNQDYIQHILSH